MNDGVDLIVGVGMEIMRVVNPFVNLNKRAIELPAGCKDLNDVLRKVGVFHAGERTQFNQGGFEGLRTFVRRFYEEDFTREILHILQLEKCVLLMVRHEEGAFYLELFLLSSDAYVMEAVTEFFGETTRENLADKMRLAPSVAEKLPIQKVRASLPEYPEQSAQVIIDFLLRAYNVSEKDKFIFSIQNGKVWPPGF